MMDNRQENRQSGEDAGRLNQDVCATLKSMGWLVPESEEQVRQAEAALALAETSATIPRELVDPEAAWTRSSEASYPGPGSLGFPADPASEQHMARAAREGGDISPEIEDKMHRDRKDAEKPFDKDEHGQVVR